MKKLLLALFITTTLIHADSNFEKRKKYERVMKQKRFKKKVVYKCGKSIRLALGGGIDLIKIQMYLTRHLIVIEYRKKGRRYRFSVNNYQCFASFIFKGAKRVEIYP